MWLFRSFVLLTGFLFLQDQTIPNGATVLRVVEGRGVQIYRCTQQLGAFAWRLEAPEATLYEASGSSVGSHGAGPVWKWKDGSSLRGTVVQKRDVGANQLPWLLLSTLPDSNVRGTLSGVTWVRRSATVGGLAPAGGCDAAHENTVSRVAYSATYTFYVGSVKP